MAFMRERHGPDVVTELHELRMTLRKVTDEELRETLARYKRMF